MDYKTDFSSGQQKENILAEQVAKIAQLCDLMQLLRAWWAHFQDALRRTDRAAAVKAHDLMTDGVVIARQLAQSLNFELSDVSNYNWSASPRPLRAGVDF